MKRLKIRITLPHEPAAVFGCGGQTIRQEPERVSIPAGNIQIGAGGEMVEIGDLAHVIMGDGGRGVPPDDIRLQTVETRHLVTGETAKRHHMRRVCLCHRQVG